MMDGQDRQYLYFLPSNLEFAVIYSVKFRRLTETNNRAQQIDLIPTASRLTLQVITCSQRILQYFDNEGTYFS